MVWAKLDDSFHSHPKVRAAWHQCAASIGLHALAITYAAEYLTDGIVPGWFVATYFQKPKEMEDAVGALLDVGMWKRSGPDFEIHDFLKYHPSKEKHEEKKAADAERKRRERAEEDTLAEAA